MRKLSNPEYSRKILYANNYAEIPIAIKNEIDGQVVEEDLIKKYGLNNSHSTIIHLCESIDGALIVIDLEWMLISFVTLSTLAASLTVGAAVAITAILLIGLFSYRHYQANKEREKLIDKVKFAYVQHEAALAILKNSSGLTDLATNYDPNRIPHSPSLFLKNPPLHKIVLSILPTCLLTTGLILTCAWALPSLLAACGIGATIASTLTPASFAVFGFITVCLIGLLIYKAYKRYQTHNRLDNLQRDLYRKKQCYLNFAELPGTKKSTQLDGTEQSDEDSEYPPPCYAMQ